MIKKWIAKGKRYDEIISLIIEESGEVALAAPMKKGFNIVGYAMPFIVMVAASIVVVFITRKWAIKKKRWKEQTIAIAGGSAHQEPNDPLKRKLIEELNDFES
jgi:cytochrome c-type biogenesis protein CcmH/NrfF